MVYICEYKMHSTTTKSNRNVKVMPVIHLKNFINQNVNFQESNPRIHISDTISIDFHRINKELIEFNCTRNRTSRRGVLRLTVDLSIY